MAVYVSSMILRSLRMIGEKVRGDTLDTNEQSECLYELNSFMDGLSIQRLFCYQTLEENFPLTTGVNTYTIGTGATFNTNRPTKIVDPCWIRDASNLDSHLRIVMTDTYGQIVQKSVGNSYPNTLYYDYGFDSSGFGNIKLYPAPTANLTLYINSWKQLQSFANVSTALALPPGYQLFIESNFAIHMAAGLTPISNEVAKIAKESRAAIMSINLPTSISRLDPGNGIPVSRGSANSILTGP